MQQPHGRNAHVHPAFAGALAAMSGDASVPLPRVAAANSGFRAMCAEMQGLADVIVRQRRESTVAAALAARPVPVRVLHATVATEAEYRAALAAHDWHFERSDDPSVWNAGQRSLFRLQATRKRIDKDGAIWNKYAPAEFRVAAKEHA